MKCLNLLMLLFIGYALPAQEKMLAFTGAYIVPVVGRPIENGVLIVHKGKIVAVGDQNLTIPRNADTVKLSGKTILPGLVDTHSHIGGPDGGDLSAALHPDARTLDAVDPASDDFKRALAGGITSVNIMPGSGLLMSGQTVYVKMRPGKFIEDLLITNEKGIFGGLKMANGTNPMRATAGHPATRAKSAAMARELFVKAQDYQKKILKAGKDSSKLPDRDLRMETLLEVLSNKRVVHFHSHKANDILTAIRLAKEFNFRLVLHHVSEGWKIADEIAKSGFPASIISIEVPGGKYEAINLSLKTGSVLVKAGALVGFHTDDFITDSRLFLRSAALMVREGLSRENALKALTINGAKMLDLESRIGSLEKGKDADFIILSGDPFSVYTKIQQTWVEGIKRWDIANPADKAFLTGGFQVFRPDGNSGHVHDDEEDEQR